MEYLAVSLIGALVGASELASRYRDKPIRLFGVLGAWAYCVVNGLAGIFALWVIESFNWTFGGLTDGSLSIARIVTASMGSLAVLRSSIFNLRIDGSDVGIGPAALLATLQGVSDRSVDRAQAKERSSSVVKAMGNVSFARSKVALPAFCLALLQNVNQDDQKELADAIEIISQGAGMTDRQRSFLMGVLLINVAGPDVVSSSVQALGQEIGLEVESEPSKLKKLSSEAPTQVLA